MLWPVETLLALYERRWRVELYFDDIKTTMQASSMRCLEPVMHFMLPATEGDQGVERRKTRIWSLLTWLFPPCIG